MEAVLRPAGRFGPGLVFGRPVRAGAPAGILLARARGGCSQPSPSIPKPMGKAMAKRAAGPGSRAAGIGAVTGEGASKNGHHDRQPTPNAPSSCRSCAPSCRRCIAAHRWSGICGCLALCSHGTASEPERCGPALWISQAASFEQYMDLKAWAWKICSRSGGSGSRPARLRPEFTPKH